MRMTDYLLADGMKQFPSLNLDKRPIKDTRLRRAQGGSDAPAKEIRAKTSVFMELSQSLELISWRATFCPGIKGSVKRVCEAARRADKGRCSVGSEDKTQ